MGWIPFQKFLASLLEALKSFSSLGHGDPRYYLILQVNYGLNDILKIFASNLEALEICPSLGHGDSRYDG